MPLFYFGCLAGFIVSILYCKKKLVKQDEHVLIEIFNFDTYRIYGSFRCNYLSMSKPLIPKRL